MSFLSDLSKKVYEVWIVPHINPNQDSVKTTVFMNPRYADNYNYIQSILDREYEDYFVVKVREML